MRIERVIVLLDVEHQRVTDWVAYAYPDTIAGGAIVGSEEMGPFSNAWDVTRGLLQALNNQGIY